MTFYKERQLPRAPLIEYESGEDYLEKVQGEDVLLIFSVIGCDACEKDLQAIGDNSEGIKSGTKIYGVMFEDRKIVEQYVQAHPGRMVRG